MDPAVQLWKFAPWNMLSKLLRLKESLHLVQHYYLAGIAIIVIYSFTRLRGSEYEALLQGIVLQNVTELHVLLNVLTNSLLGREMKHSWELRGH